MTSLARGTGPTRAPLSPHMVMLTLKFTTLAQRVDAVLAMHPEPATNECLNCGWYVCRGLVGCDGTEEVQP